jgi:hypothetical protein
VPLDVDVEVVGDVEDNLGDRAAGEPELRGVGAADGVAAVVADAQSLAGEIVVNLVNVAICSKSLPRVIELDGVPL